MEGKLLKVNEAFDAGLIDEISPAESLITTAERKIRTYMQLNPITWSQSKLNLRKELIEKLNTDQSATLNNMLQQWWAPETRKGLQMLIQNLKSKSTAAQ
jgi:enoyl-CoA hydratase/carnithine racemase